MGSRNRVVCGTLFFLLSIFSLTCLAQNIDPKQYVLTHVPVKKNGVIKEMTLPSAMEYFKVPAISFAVIENNKIIWVKAVGYTDSHKTQQINDQTLFQAGSLSKSVAAVAALSMVEVGQLSLDAPVNPLLKGWKIVGAEKFKNDSVTLRELLSMSSGLNGGGYYGYEPKQPLPNLIETLLGKSPANGQSVTMIYKPGSRYEYSGGGYEVMELLMDSKSSQTFPEIVQHFIFTPLNLTHSTYQQPLAPQFQKNAAKATDSNGNPFPYIWRVNPEYAAAGLWTTPYDMAKFVLEIIKAYQNQPTQIISHAIAHQAIAQQKNTFLWARFCDFR